MFLDARRSLAGDPAVGVSAVVFGPFWLYLLIDALRRCRISYGNNLFTPAQRPAAYWTHILIFALLVVLFAIVLAEGLSKAA